MAKKVKPQAKAKKPPEKQHEKQVGRLLVRVPVEYVFWCHDGRMFADLRELAEGLVAMSDDTFAYHVNPEKNDFYNWIRDVIEDTELASELAAASTRLQAAGCVSARVALITDK
jgi:hypothetical protein